MSPLPIRKWPGVSTLKSCGEGDRGTSGREFKTAFILLAKVISSSTFHPSFSLGYDLEATALGVMPRHFNSAHLQMISRHFKNRCFSGLTSFLRSGNTLKAGRNTAGIP